VLAYKNFLCTKISEKKDDIDIEVKLLNNLSQGPRESYDQGDMEVALQKNNREVFINEN